MGGAACNLILLSSGRYTLKYKFRSNRIPYTITPGSICRRSPVRHRSEFDLNLYTLNPPNLLGGRDLAT